MRLHYETTGERDRAGVINTEIMNAIGYCLFGNAITPPGHLVNVLSAVTGFSYTENEANDLGLRSYTIRHAFNLREGMNRKSFTLSKRFTESKPPVTGPLADVTVDNEKLADNFFRAMDWDPETLIPSKESLESIGQLDNVIKELY